MSWSRAAYGGEGRGGSRLIPAQRPGLAKRLRPGRGEGRPGARGRCATVKCGLPEPRRFRFRGLRSLKLRRQCVPGILEQARASGRPGSAGRDGGVVEVTAGNRTLAAEGAGGEGECVQAERELAPRVFMLVCVRHWGCTLK